MAELDETMGLLPDARAGYQRAVRVLTAAHGESHPKVAETLARLGAVEQALGNAAPAREHLTRALAIFERFLPADDPQIQALRGALNGLG
jgi:tetratricopeptide (TPR) repeat protein